MTLDGLSYCNRSGWSTAPRIQNPLAGRTDPHTYMQTQAFKPDVGTTGGT